MARAKAKAKQVFVEVNYDGILDAIESEYKLTQANMDPEVRTSSMVNSGMLVTNLILGGGIIPGGWYTIFGGEQSAKSTHIMTMVSNAFNNDVPVIVYYDYEGCVQSDTRLLVNGEEVSFRDFIPKELPEKEGWTGIKVKSDTLGGTVNAEVFYGGIKPLTEIKTESGKVLRGYNHPVMVKDSEGLLQWRLIEGIKRGDVVIETRQP